MAQFSIEQINKMIDEKNNEFEITWAGGEATVKHTVGLRDIVAIVMQTASECFDEDGAYLPEVKDFVLWSHIVDYYTDIELPSSIEIRADVFIKTDLIEAIREAICLEQLSSIESAVDAHIKNTIDAGNNLIMNKVLETVITLGTMQGELEKAISSFNGINPEELQAYVQKKAAEAK